MEALNFSNESFVLYQILPNHKKIKFLMDSFDSEDVDELSIKYYRQHFAGVLSNYEDDVVGIVSYMTPDGYKVNVFFHDNYIHINSERLIPIKTIVHAIFTDGNILIRDHSLKKTKKNKDRFHMRYYRAYIKVNPEGETIPMVLS